MAPAPARTSCAATFFSTAMAFASATPAPVCCSGTSAPLRSSAQKKPPVSCDAPRNAAYFETHESIQAGKLVR
eukprot:6196941-Pleurochrysis_carterae.AAC.1